jgi:hypothetical protein
MKGSFKRIFYYEDILSDPFQRIRRVPCFCGLLFFISTGVNSGLNGSRTAERRTPQDAEGRRRRLRSDRSRISNIVPTGTEPPFCSCRVSPSLEAAAVFRQGDNVPSFVLLSLSSCVVYFVICVIRIQTFFILFVNPTPVILELRFDSIPFVLRSHRACTSIVGGSREFHF